MPQAKRNNAADTARGSNQNTWPRRNEDGTADVILLPDDLLEGAGNLADINQDGQPDGIPIVPTSQPDARDLYVGTRADQTTRQNPSPLPIEQSSYLVNHPIVETDPPPGPGVLTAKIVPPGKPTIKLEAVTRAGFPEATPESPLWIAFGYRQGEARGTIGPPASFTGGQGQSYRVTLPDSNPPTATGLDIYVTEPGTSSASTPGPFHLQATVDLFSHAAPTFDLLGPYKFDASPGGTSSGRPRAPKLIQLADVRLPARPGTWTTVITYTTRTLAEGFDEIRRLNFQLPPGWSMTGESEPSQFSESVTIAEEGDEGTGYGPMKLIRPALPPSAKGWMAYAGFTNDAGNPIAWGNLLVGGYGASSSLPYPLSYTEVEFNGWAPNTRPRGNWTSGGFPLTIGTPAVGVSPPDSPPEPPLPFGAARPGAGKYYVRETHEVRGLETLPSLPADAQVGEDEIMRVEFFNQKNRLPNATVREKDAQNLPVSYTVTQTGGQAYADSGRLILETTSATSGTTPEALTPVVEIDPTQEWSVALRLKMDNPLVGALSGSVQALLRQTNASGTNTDSVLATVSAKGEKEIYEIVLPAGQTGDFVWNADTVSTRIVYRFSGATKNAILTASRQVLKGYRWAFRRRLQEAGVFGVTDVPPETAIPPGTDISVEPPPPPPVPPAGDTVSDPDRPTAQGTVIEEGDYESGYPSGWTQNATGSAVISRTAGAALSGSVGLRLLKSSGGQLSSANLSKSFPPESWLSDRHSLAGAKRYRVQSLTDGAHLDMHALCGTDGQKFAWLRYAKAFESARLSVQERPTRPGNVVVNLNGVATNIAVVAVQEQATLSLSSGPTGPGFVRIHLDGTIYAIPAGGVRELFAIRVDRAPATAGYITLTAGGDSVTFYVAPQDTTTQIANKFRFAGLHGWTVSTSFNNAAFQADLAGPRDNATLNVGTTGMRYTLTTQNEGLAETASELAARIRGGVYSGWTTSGTDSDVVFTAVQAGPRVDASYDPKTTGAAGTMTTNTQGALDTTSDLAARIRGTSFSGWTTGGTTNVVSFIATTSGQKQDAFYDSGPTGAYGVMETLVQGSSGDVSVITKDADDVEDQKKVLLNVGTSVFDVDLAVSGADASDPDGEPYRSAILNFFGSVGGTKELKARSENLDLTDYPANVLKVGIVEESSASATWEVHADDLKVTDRGELHYEDHDAWGAVINQLYYHGPPIQEPLDDVLVQDYRQAVIPGTQIALSAIARWDSIPISVPVKPLGVYALFAEDEEVFLGDVLGGATGISGTSAWGEPSPLFFTVPEECYELSIRSTRLSAGELVIQQIAGSVGSAVKRTPLYATSGTHRTTLDVRTPVMRSIHDWGRERRLLAVTAQEPTGTSIVPTYRSGDPHPDGTITWGDWVTDQALVEQGDVLQANLAMTGNGFRTPVVRAGSPVADYRLLVGLNNLATLLKHDDTELPGGAIFETLQDFEDLSEILVRPKPGGDFDRAALYDPVRQLPEFTLQVFTPEAKQYVAANWGLEYFVVEDEGKALTVKLRGFSGFDKAIPRVSVNGQTYSLYKAKIPAGSVAVSTRELR